jgi:outer membrane lipoprotein-sorting protein
MRYRLHHYLIAAAFSCTFLLSAQSSHTPGAGIQNIGASVDKARALVQEQARAVQSMDRFSVSHQVDITAITSGYNRTTHAYVTTWVQRPGHIRAESRQYTGSEILVSDGSATWVYDGANRTYSKQMGGAPVTLFSNAFPGLARQLSSVNLPSVTTTATLVGTESLTVAGRKYLCDIVDVTVVPSASNSALKDNLLHVWISQEYKVPLKVEATFAGATPADLKKYSDYVTDFEPNLIIPASTWTFSPPPDARQKAEVTSPMPRN